MSVAQNKRQASPHSSLELPYCIRKGHCGSGEELFKTWNWGNSTSDGGARSEIAVRMQKQRVGPITPGGGITGSYAKDPLCNRGG